MVKVFPFVLMFFSLTVSAQSLNLGDVKKLSPEINSQYEEGLPLITPDGKSMFFTRFLSPQNFGGQYTGADVWVSHFDYQKKEWSNGDNKALKFNTKGNNAVIGISRNGETLYVMNAMASKRLTGIYLYKKIEKNWVEHEFIPIPNIQTTGHIGMHVSPDLDVIFLSMNGADSRGEEDLYISLKNSKGAWSDPKNLGPSVNTTGFEISPFLSPDKTRLFFSSNGHAGFGDADIFYCDRLYDSWETWSAARNAGEKVNSKYFEAYFSTYGDSIAYFVSNRDGHLSDIYSINLVIPKPTPGGDISLSFLSDLELEKIAGARLNRTLFFDVNIANLSDNHINVLDHIIDVFGRNDNIKLHLVAHKPAESMSLEVYQQRLINVLNYLKRGGIPGLRITFGLETKATKSLPENERIDVLFYTVF